MPSSWFVDSLTFRIQSARKHSERLNGTAHLTVLLLNRDAYHAVERFQSERENLNSRIQVAWARALRFPFEEADGLVHIPANATFHLSQDAQEEMHRYFHRVS
ncbi:inovirus-type Gp2 protein [Pseudomonas sp. D47]|uniref:YagK/YfjJ domain-containing protein n=1 Tax=Pseudomonas sp. D47 TaxID=3159447 RepID=UPI00387A858E